MMLIRHELPTLPNRYHVGRNFESPIWLPVRTLSLIVRMICSELPFKYCARSGHPWPAPWILAGSATGSREAVLGVFAKLFEDRLEGRLEDETICQCEIGGYAMDFLIGRGIHVDGWGRASRVAAVAHALSKSCWAKAVSLSKVIDLRSAGFMRAKIGSMTKIVSAAVFSASRAARVTRGFALMENEHRPRAHADDEVALPMAGLGPGVDGNAILDSISRRPRSGRTMAFVAARQIAPELLPLWAMRQMKA